MPLERRSVEEFRTALHVSEATSPDLVKELKEEAKIHSRGLWKPSTSLHRQTCAPATGQGLADAEAANPFSLTQAVISSPLSSGWQRSEPMSWAWQWQATRPAFLRAHRGRRCTAAPR